MGHLLQPNQSLINTKVKPYLKVHGHVVSKRSVGGRFKGCVVSMLVQRSVADLAGKSSVEAQHRHCSPSCLPLRHVQAHHTFSSYIRSFHPSRLNQMLNTNPSMAANQERCSLDFDRVVKVQIRVLSKCWRAGAKFRDVTEFPSLWATCLSWKASCNGSKRPGCFNYFSLFVFLPLTFILNASPCVSVNNRNCWNVLYQPWRPLSVAHCRL